MLKNFREFRKGRLHGALRRGHLAALREFVEKSFPDPTKLFEHGLSLLVQHLEVDQAVMTRITNLGYEPFWWAQADGFEPDQALHETVILLCQQALEHPGRTLVIKDLLADLSYQGRIRAYVGAQLRRSGEAIGVLSVQSSHPIQFTRAQIGMVNAMADLFSRTLEIEALKAELCMTRDTLDLTTAVMEDSALESPGTHLPNRRYLDIWLKANLYLARRRAEVMAVIRWKVALNRDSRKALKEINESLRGEDLLVDLGDEEFLLLLPRTEREGAEILLERIRQRLGQIGMGATLWNPSHKLDRDDLNIKKAMKRANLAFRESVNQGSSDICWDILPLNPEDLADITRSW